MNSDGTVTYTPAPDFNGNDLFTYTVKDEQGQISNIATVNIVVNDINDLPIAVDDVITIEEDVQSMLNIVENDTDVDGTLDVSGVILVSDPPNGVVEITAEGVKYTPQENFTGTDTFTYTITDDDGAVSNVATVNLTITDVNDAPVDLILSNTFIHEDEPIGYLVGTFTTVDFDPNETFTYSFVVGDGSEDNGAFTIDGKSIDFATTFDQDQQEFYNIRVKTDDGESALEQTFVISIFSDQNPPFIIPGELPRFHPVTNQARHTVSRLKKGFDVDRVLFSFREYNQFPEIRGRSLS